MSEASDRLIHIIISFLAGLSAGFARDAIKYWLKVRKK